MAGGGSNGLVIVAGGGSDVVTVIVAGRCGSGPTVAVSGRWDVGEMMIVSVLCWRALPRPTGSRSAGTVVTEWMIGVGGVAFTGSVERTMPSVRTARSKAAASPAPASAIVAGHL